MVKGAIFRFVEPRSDVLQSPLARWPLLTSRRGRLLRSLFPGSLLRLGRRALRLRPPLADVPAPSAQRLDHLGRDSRRDGDPDEDEGLVDGVCQGQLRPYAYRRTTLAPVPCTISHSRRGSILALSPRFASSAALTP